ncbi:MAG: methyltransferase [Flavobacteriales bacterium]|nr:methyltransferase [Flavobacteriales bacterium]|tara:strand:+ start:17282 stop:17917 length:636 start_codon:yes stop_codon:yes gene_type:complete
MEFINNQIIKYAECHSDKESNLLEELSRETWAKVLNPRMLSGHIQGRILSMISNMINPKNIIEIGTYTGYSALCLAEGLKKQGELHTIDINEEHINIAKKFFKKSQYNNNIITYNGNAIDIIPKLNLKFQLAFIDADKENYSKYLDLLIDKMEQNSYIIADNVLWSGKVIKDEMDLETKSLDTYNKKVLNDKRLETVLLPIRDGLMVTKIK